MNPGKVLLSHINKWVALTHDEKKVVASATDLRKLDLKVKKTGLKDVIYHYILPPDKFFSP